jgi:hypothetical protein
MLHQRSIQRHGCSAGLGRRQQQQMLRRATVAHAVAVEGKRTSKKQLDFPFTRIQVGVNCPILLPRSVHWCQFAQASDQVLWPILSHAQPYSSFRLAACKSGTQFVVQTHYVLGFDNEAVVQHT